MNGSAPSVRMCLLAIALLAISCGESDSGGSGEVPRSFLNLISMHAGVLRETGFQPTELGESHSFTVSSAVDIGDTTIELVSTDGLVDGQLIAMEGSSGGSFSAKVVSVTTTGVALGHPLETALRRGDSVWNFYHDFAHPNSHGYLAITDYALRHLVSANLNWGNHVLLGDSWFSGASISDHLKQALPKATFVNEGHGGDTVAAILDRFDADVPPHAPDFVWLMAGTNDYFRDVSADSYRTGMQDLIERVEAEGAVALVFDPSVGPEVYGSYPAGELTRRSQEYAEAAKVLTFDRWAR